MSILLITDAAAQKIAELVEQEGNSSLKLRIFVQGGGCSGLQYGFTFDEEIGDDDQVVQAGAIGVLVDAMSLQYLAGAQVDYKASLEGEQFVINNPNATTTCGCGSSFSAA